MRQKKLTRNRYLYTRYAPPEAIAKPIKITHTAAHADDFDPPEVLPADIKDSTSKQVLAVYIFKTFILEL